MYTFKKMVITEFKTEKCCQCNIEFAVPAEFMEWRQRDGNRFFCPNGHGMIYGESDATKLRRERDRLAQQIAQRDDEIVAQRTARESAEREVLKTRSQITKMRKRASAGVCPCCNRTFAELAAHMNKKHPEFITENGGKVVRFKAVKATA